MTITPLLLCGGSGSRLWPLSRKSFPKQFTRLHGEESLFQQALTRMSGPEFGAPAVVTNSDFRFIVTEQMAAMHISPSAILIEPSGRNTAPAVLAGLLELSRRDPEGLLLVLPSDQIIPNTEAFRAVVLEAAKSARAGKIVTFGITPDRAETGYGWLELATIPAQGGAIDLLRFVEKPDVARATTMLEAGNFLWNAGIFLFSVQAGLAAFGKHAPGLIGPVTAALDTAQSDIGFTRLDAKGWNLAQDISIDFAVMEKASNLVVLPFAAGWSDLGDWAAVWRAQPDLELTCNATHGDVTVIDCEGSLMRAESEGQVLVGIGLKDMIAVAMKDAVLVAPRDRAQDVKRAVEVLKAQGRAQAETFPRDHRPWGWFETLALADRFQVKRIVVKPGAALSLQSHVHRSEHWIVVSGTARVTIGAQVQLLTENQSVYIPLGEKHRLENPGRVHMVLIEVQTGAYLGEDDIVRYEDIYARGAGVKG